MNLAVRIRSVVAVVAVGVGLLAVPTPAAAEVAPALGGSTASGAVTASFDGTKGPSDDGSGGVRTNAVGDVTIDSQGCAPDPVAFGDQTTCTYAVQNQTQTATTVDLQASGDAELAVVGADQGAVVSNGTARAEDVALPPRASSPIQVNPGSTFAGYYPLESIPIAPQTINDDQILNYTVQPYRWNGATYTSIGISANGHAVVGGADTAKDSSATPQDLPDAGRPNNVLAPFWTDLTPAGGGSLRVATVANTAQPPCERSYWFVAQWDMFEYGTTTNRKAQLWIQADDPECATDPVPAETVYFTYDFTTMNAAPARPFRIGAENSAGTVGGMRPAGQLPSQQYVVTSSGTPQPAPVVTWKVVGKGQGAGTGTVAATVESTLIPGSSTVFTDVTVSAEAAPVVTTDPADRTVTAGQQAVFTAAATGAASMRWQVSTDDGQSWDDIPGATATTLAFTTAGADDGNRYRAVFASSSGVEATTAEATLTVDRIASTTSVVPSPAAPDVGQAVSFTATVAPAGATGTVQFAADGNALGAPVAVSGGTATSSSTSALAAGDHAVTATYSGDADHAGSVANATVSVGKVASSVTVVLDPTSPVVGDDVSFTATVAPSAATGSVQFTVDGTPLGSPVALAGGTATSPDLSGLGRGSHVVEAAYTGSTTYAAATSGPVTFSVARRSTTTTVAVDPTSPQRRDDVTYTATVAPTPTGGTVQFTVDGSPLGGPVAVSGGVATSPAGPSPSAGDHTVVATFTGDDAFAPSTSTASAFTVAKRASTTSVVVAALSVPAAGEDVSIDVSVSPVPVGGTVQVALDGADVGAPLALGADGTVTATLPAVVAGDHTFTASFSGDADLQGSVSPEAALLVFGPQEAFVRRAFPLVVGRPADPGGVAYFVGLLDAGQAPESVAWRMASSAEARRHLVDLTYQRALSRPADPDGREFWARRLGSGLSAEDLLATLAATSEAYQRNGSDPAGTAMALFRIHLDRAPGTAELASWRNRIAATNTPAGRRRTALTFGRTSEATRVASTRAATAACGTATGSEVLAPRWPASGRNPLRLVGSALALVCPPPGLTT